VDFRRRRAMLDTRREQLTAGAPTLADIRRWRRLGQIDADAAHRRILDWLDLWIATLREIRALPER
jgi:hypothetical protein